jgi:hypothetical protein
LTSLRVGFTEPPGHGSRLGRDRRLVLVITMRSMTASRVFLPMARKITPMLNQADPRPGAMSWTQATTSRAMRMMVSGQAGACGTGAGRRGGIRDAVVILMM